MLQTSCPGERPGGRGRSPRGRTWKCAWFREFLRDPGIRAEHEARSGAGRTGPQSQSLREYENVAGRHMPRRPTFPAILAVFGLAVLPCCRRGSERGEPPPPPAVQSPCELPESPGMSALSPELPARAVGHCVDPRIDVRSYGVGAKAPLDSVCTELFNGECELYKTYGLEAVRTFEYAPSVGTDHAVSVVVSEFRSGQGAFGFFTRRILGGGPPEALTVEPLELHGQGALGAGVAYLRRG